MRVRHLTRPTSRRRPRPEHPPQRVRPADPAAPPEAPPERVEETRVRSAGGPDDVAVYTCGCGLMWEAHVTASVRCPRCADTQAW